MEKEIPAFTPDMFEFAPADTQKTDGGFAGAPRGYFADALLRFRKNKSSVIAAFIIAFLVLFSIFSPIISPYTVFDKDNVYSNCPPYAPTLARLGIGVLDGA